LKKPESVLIIGSSPIVIGQGAEFDYSGTQACKVLRQEGIRVILVNSNPATIMTDPELADATYIEPITAPILEQVIIKEKPAALLPTMGGQTGLNVAVELAESGFLKTHGVQLIGAQVEAIKKAEDRDLFKKAAAAVGLTVPIGDIATTWSDAEKLIGKIGFPAIIRSAFTLGGVGGSTAYNMEEYKNYVERGLTASPISEVMIEQSIIGWKEYELEVMRDRADNVVIVCSIENFDPMGVHTGDSITVAPQQTLSDVEYQEMRDKSIALIREIGVETGGSNIQFAVHPGTGEMMVIEMNPRVSRSSALASKATGFPIAKIAAQLAIGYTLDQITNDITGETPASFEPTLDYVVVKVPRWDFEKFPKADKTLGVQMKAVGEVMSFGRNFREALQKALRSLEIGRSGLEEPSIHPLFDDSDGKMKKKIKKNLTMVRSQKIFDLRAAFFRNLYRLFHRISDSILGVFDIQIIQDLPEFFSVFGEVDILRRSSIYHASCIFKGFRQFQRCLSSELDDHSVRLLGIHHVHDILECQRLEKEFVGCIVIGAYRFRIAVYHRDFKSFFPKSHYRVYAAVIEFYSLSYPVRTAAENNNFFPVTRFQLIFFFISGIHIWSIRTKLCRTRIDSLINRYYSQLFPHFTKILLGNSAKGRNVHVRKTLLFHLPNKIFILEFSVTFCLCYTLFKIHDHSYLIQEPWIDLSQIVYLIHCHVDDKSSSQIEYFLTPTHSQIFLYLFLHLPVTVVKKRMNRRFLKTAASYFQRP